MVQAIRGFESHPLRFVPRSAIVIAEPSRAPVVHVIAGPNGAGKTTFATQFLPKLVHCEQFLNADLIAAGLSPFAPETQRIRAGRLLLERMAELQAKRQDFGFETTLSGRGHAAHLRELKRVGYQVLLYFLWLPDVDLAVKRVANRVRQGGHHVPEEDIRRRYRSGIRNFFRIYREIADVWQVFDQLGSLSRLIASEDRQGRLIIDPASFALFESEALNS